MECVPLPTVSYFCSWKKKKEKHRLESGHRDLNSILQWVWPLASFGEHDARCTHDVCPNWEHARDWFKGRTVCQSGRVTRTDPQGFGAAVVSSAKVQELFPMCVATVTASPLLHAGLWTSNWMRSLVHGYRRMQTMCDGVGLWFPKLFLYTALCMLCVFFFCAYCTLYFTHELV